MNSQKYLLGALLLTAILIVQGFRFVTQSGLNGYEGIVQNDGYATIGGVMILLGGIATGVIISRKLKESNAKK